MKKSNFFLVVIFLLSTSGAFAINDKNGLNHNFVDTTVVFRGS